jgi:acyl-coenzyme A thioesterase PaaI-like protein
MPTPLDELRQLVDGTRPPPPIATLIGFTLTAVLPGEAVIELAASRQHANPMGALHGGVLCDIADAAMGIAYASTLAEGETFATIELVRGRDLGQPLEQWIHHADGSIDEADAS